MADSRGIVAQLNRLFAGQRFAVLATQSRGQPYGTLVAFAETPGLDVILFVTGRKTRKYSDAVAGRKVAMVIDSRMNRASDLSAAVAVTATGEVEEVVGSQHDHLAEIYLAKHPALAGFVKDGANALMKITVAEYVVASFDKVQRIRTDSL